VDRDTGPARKRREAGVRRPARGTEQGGPRRGWKRRPSREEPGRQPGKRGLAQPGRRNIGPAGLAAYSSQDSFNPAQENYNLAGIAICRPSLLFNCFSNIPAYMTRYLMCILVITKEYFGILGVISPTLAPKAVGDSQSRAQASTKYTKVPTHILLKLICWPA
jgi:hypothetical protein